MRIVLPVAFAILLAATAAGADRLSAPQRGLILAQTHCAGCHAVTVNGTSPDPEAPAWEDIANRPGTTQATLRRFLADSHNYPAAMQFRVERRHIRDLSAWMVTLQRDGYQPTR